MVWRMTDQKNCSKWQNVYTSSVFLIKLNDSKIFNNFKESVYNLFLVTLWQQEKSEMNLILMVGSFGRHDDVEKSSS